MTWGFRKHFFWWLGCSLGMLCCLGCGSNTSTTEDTQTTSHEDIVSFLEENPEFAEPAGELSDTSELGLER